MSSEAFQNLLTDVRQNWITWNHNKNESYNLEEPNIEDPSMGQSTVIREILNETTVKQLLQFHNIIQFQYIINEFIFFSEQCKIIQSILCGSMNSKFSLLPSIEKWIFHRMRCV